MASFDTTRRLVGALDAARTFRRQSAGLLALLLACAAWILSSADTPEPFAGLLLAVAACALVIELGLALAARRQEAACADELILSGFGCESTRTPVERAVARRASWLERPRTRHRLAKHLRWRLKLAEGSLGISPGYMRTSVHPPLARYERSALLVNYTLIREMADRLERGPTDPRALVLLWSVVLAPPSLDRGAVGRAAGEELASRIRLARRIVDRDRETPVSPYPLVVDAGADGAADAT